MLTFWITRAKTTFKTPTLHGLNLSASRQQSARKSWALRLLFCRPSPSLMALILWQITSKREAQPASKEFLGTLFVPSNSCHQKRHNSHLFISAHGERKAQLLKLLGKLTPWLVGFIISLHSRQVYFPSLKKSFLYMKLYYSGHCRNTHWA